jgi:hypothetical protein
MPPYVVITKTRTGVPSSLGGAGQNRNASQGAGFPGEANVCREGREQRSPGSGGEGREGRGGLTLQ